MIWGMPKPKSKKVVDNAWLAAELVALGINQADLARGTGITPDKVNKSLKNNRLIPLEEYKLIKAFLEQASQKRPNNYQPSQPENCNNETAGSTENQESEGMNRDSGLSDEITRDLLVRVRRLEDKIAELALERSKNPQRGRKR